MLFDLKKYGEKIAVVENNREYTYEELNEAAERIAGEIPDRTLVFSFCTASFASIAGYVAFIDHRIVPLLLDASMDDTLVTGLIKTYTPEYLWMPEGHEPYSDMGYNKIYAGYGYILLRADGGFKGRLFDELALLISTSGSTGSPKLVRQSYKNLVSNTEAIVEYLKITENERAIASLTMNYVYGLSVINTHLYTGATLILTEAKCYSKQFWELCDKEKVTSFAGIPFMYEMMKKLGIFKKDLPTLKTLTQAGGKLTPELHHYIAEYAKSYDKAFVVMYGASEATARMGYLPPERALDKKGSMGIAIPNGRFELTDTDGSVIDRADTAGELVYYGDNVTLGYAECLEDLEKEDENHGRLETGDIAKRDSEGFYYIIGRKKRFIKILGKRVNLDETERLLKDNFSDMDIACAGGDDKLKVFVVNGQLIEGITRYIVNVLNINPNLMEIRTVDEIPKNASGKTLYEKLNEL